MIKRRSHTRTGFNAGPLVVAYYVFGVPFAGYGIIALANLPKSNGWFGVLFVYGSLAIIILFSVGRRWVREKDQQIAQNARDRRAVQICDWVSTGKLAERANPYSLYLRPFKSTGHVRIPLRSSVLKRGVLAGPTPGIFDPELGWTIRYKRYVTFGDFETELAELVEPYAPLIALGRTGEQIGAGRIPSDDKHWRATFELLAKHATVIFLVPSTQDGTQWEIERICSDARFLHKTVLFVPPNDTILGGEVGPHLQSGAAKGPVGMLDVRKAAIGALAKLAYEAPIARIEKDEWGVLLRLTDRRRVGSYHALRMTKSLSLNPFTVGSNMRIDRVHLRREVQAIMVGAAANLHSTGAGN